MLPCFAGRMMSLEVLRLSSGITVCLRRNVEPCSFHVAMSLARRHGPLTETWASHGAMGFASTLVVKVTRCASNCSLHNFVASLYDSVLLSDIRLVIHSTSWRLAETGREATSAARALPDATPIPIATRPHAATLILTHLELIPIPNGACPASIQHTMASMAGGRGRSRRGFLQILWGYADRNPLKSFTIAPDSLYVVGNKPIFVLQQLP